MLTFFVRATSRLTPAAAFTRAAYLLALAPLSSTLHAAPPLFPANNPWNQRITNAPVSPYSAGILNRITTLSGNGRLHPDFSQNFAGSAPLYGIPYNVVQGNSTPKVPVVLGAYASQSDHGDCPIPPNAVLEGDNQNGPVVGLNARGDSHLIVWDQDNNIVYEFYRASRPSENADGKWHADSQCIWNMNTNSFRTLGWTSADAAGLPILPGLARPDEALPVSQGGQGIITHPIRFTLTNSVILHQYIFPASHVANPGNTDPATRPPMGARFRLKASVNISNFYPQAKVIAQAMKDYGLILADNGSNFYFTGASASVNSSNLPTLTWNDDDVQDNARGLKALRFNDFEMVDLTPVVAAVIPNHSASGSTITIRGLNFSGAAGQMSVLFGSTPSPSVTYIDDENLSVVVPAGSGAVNIRVQSGRTVAPSSQNYESPIFGYGLSETTPASAFTFGVPCPGDFNGDALVDDADFVLFASAYDTLLCPSAPTPCPADLNSNAVVDDADFVIFANSYNALLCP